MNAVRLVLTLGLLLLAGQGGHSASPPAGRLPDADTVARVIDSHLARSLEAARVHPSPRADDPEFLRRVHLDLAVRIPSVAEARAFLADRRAERRERLIDRLLARPAFTNHLARVFRAAWVPQATTSLQTQHPGLALEAWLSQRLRKDARYDALARDLLTAPLDYLDRRADGPSPLASAISPVAFCQAGDLKPETVTGNLSRLFLGVRMECAQCHDHPFDKWTRKQFWQTAAFFASVTPPEPGQSTTSQRPLSLRRQLEDPLDKMMYQARFLDDREPDWRVDADPRRAFAGWLTAPDNPYFARVAVNRVRAQLFGVGLVDPVDDFGPHNEPSHPALLDDLARLFVEARYHWAACPAPSPPGTHARNFDSLKALCGVLAPAWAALMSDLESRGLLTTTTVVWRGEFGRTPRINPQAGRDHYPNAWSVVFGRGGIKGGQVIGQTSKDGASVERRPVSVPDLPLPRKSKATKRPVWTLWVAPPARGWFERLDANGDGQLSLPELRAAWDRLADADAMERGDLSLPDAAATHYTFTLQPGDVSEHGVRLRRPATRATRGPTWFVAMDRNGDGYVSREEFLGPDKEFARLDRDGDGLISPEEAEGKK